jgi:hypothetical protein
MAREGAGRRPAVVVPVVVPVVVMALSVLMPLVVVTAPAAAAPRKGTTLQKPPKLAQSGPVAFWGCPAKTTEMLVAVNSLTLHPGATLDLSFIVKNGGTASCNYTAPYAGVAPGPTSTSLTAGPCGSVSYTIEDAHHHDVWPGAEVVNCPALGFAQLGAGATVSGSGSWNQDKPNSAHRVAPGTYTLIVENKHFSFTLHIDKS